MSRHVSDALVCPAGNASFFILPGTPKFLHPPVAARHADSYTWAEA